MAVINILSKRRHEYRLGILFCVVHTSGALAEMIFFSGPEFITPGESFSVLAHLEENDDPLIGYSLDVFVERALGAAPLLTPNRERSNLFSSRNFIVQGGGDLDERFEIIQTYPDGRIFFNALNETLIPVPRASPPNDVLAEIVFDVLPQATGSFTIRTGPVTELLDESFQSVSFDSRPFTVQVPEPATAICFAWGLVLYGLLRSKSAVPRSRCPGADERPPLG